jgi:tellurite resistance protein
MFNALKNAVNKVREKFDNVTNESELKAVVSAAVLVAAADGFISDAEKETAFQAIASHESLQSFNQQTIRKLFDSDVNLINADRPLATGVLEKNVTAITETTARIRVLGIARQIANADGELSKSEEQVIDRIRKITG